MKATKILLVLVLGILVAVPAYAWWWQEDPVNIDESAAFYDYRDYGTWRTVEGGSEGSSGAYFQISIGVVLGGCLESYDDVIKADAVHLGTRRRFSLVRDRCTIWIQKPIQYWGLFMRPESWMFEGTWRFIMIYKDSDRRRHRQTKDYEMRPVAFPMKPSHIHFDRDELTLSWSAIGNPWDGPFDYRVRIYDGGCVVAEIRGEWLGWSPGPGWYDHELNRVVFPIGAGVGHSLRLENRINIEGKMSRACQYMVLPE